MTSSQLSSDTATDASRPTAVPMRFEVTMLPVADVDRAKAFYQVLGWRLDADFPIDGHYRVVQFTPPGSAASIQFGKGVTRLAPGSMQDMMLIVEDIDAARDELIRYGVDVSEVWHGRRDVAADQRLLGPDPERTSYRTYASFSDPDGNGWLLQEITQRLPGRV
jgi:catechol 2,3-dioxygenase-like lactoylglutathione lyase family enzyme